jgi:hypothetical protein
MENDGWEGRHSLSVDSQACVCDSQFYLDRFGTTPIRLGSVQPPPARAARVLSRDPKTKKQFRRA